MMKLIGICLALGSCAGFQIAAEEASGSLHGSVKVAEKTKGGPVYLMIRSDGGSGIIVPKLEDGPDGADKKEKASSGSQFQGYLSVGTLSGDELSFDVDLPTGSYDISAFIQNGEKPISKCVVVKLNGLDVAQSCFPGRGDTVCPSVKVIIPGSTTINCGTAIPDTREHKS